MFKLWHCDPTVLGNTMILAQTLDYELLIYLSSYIKIIIFQNQHLTSKIMARGKYIKCKKSSNFCGQHLGIKKKRENALLY